VGQYKGSARTLRRSENEERNQFQPKKRNVEADCTHNCARRKFNRYCSDTVWGFNEWQF